MKFHATSDDEKTLCGKKIPYVTRMGIKMPTTIIALDISDHRNVMGVTCKKCQNLCPDDEEDR